MIVRVTEWLIRLRPEPGGGMDPAIATPVEGDGVVTRLLEPVESALANVPPLVLVGLLLLSGAATVFTLPLARRQARRAGARAAGHAEAEQGDQALFLAAMIPAALFLTAVLAGSFRGLAAFGRDTLRWTAGWEYLVPGTLDGVALSFGFLAFRAVKRGQSPDRANRLVWAAALASAVINFAHEAGLPAGSWLGGAYLGLMSVFGMLIFHEFLAQFEEGAEAVHRKTPKFGLRWITWPTNTACAWVAWHNHPAPEGTLATVAAAVAHLENVRAAKRATLAATDHPTPWWTPLAPWVRIRQLEAIGEAERAAGDAQRAELTADVDRARTEMADRLSKVESELAAERSAVDRLRAEFASQAAAMRLGADRAGEAHRAEIAALRQALTEAAERARIERAETVAELEAKHAAEIAQMRAERATVSLTDYRREHPTGKRTGKGAKTSPAAPLTDEQAVQMLLDVNRDPSFEWSQAEVRRVTGVGFSRTARIITAITEYHRRMAGGEGSAASTGEGLSGLSGDGADDAEERSA
jgi:Skp family chaperone for outer membrane proteins